MAASEKGNIKITGTGTASGGDFGSVRITGEAIIHGDMRCERFSCIGTCNAEGGLSAKRLRLLGEAVLEGALASEDLRLTGRIEAKGGVRARTMIVRGEISTDGDLEADRLNARGAFDVGGLLNAGQADIRLYGPSRAQDIGGGTIHVRRRGFRALRTWFTSSEAPELVAGTIEGDDIYLEHTQADVVRGKRIELGPGCRVGRAEYSESFRRHKSAEVGEERKEQ